MSAASTPGSAPRSMSSRLLTMKFMQRAAASPTPTPSTPEEPSPKRRKKDSDSPGTPSFDVNTLVNQRAIEAAAVAEDAKRQAALERAAAESGDTRWVLSFEDQRVAAPSLALRIVQTGYANLDVPSKFKPAEEEIEEEKPVMVGRRSFGKFNNKLKKQNDEDESDSSSEEDEEEESEDDDDDDDDDDPASEMITASRREAVERVKAEQKAKKHAETAKAKQLAKDRKKKTVNLNELTSISGSGGGGQSFGGSKPKISCFACGGPHKKSDCPRERKRVYGGDNNDGPSRKIIKTR